MFALPASPAPYPAPDAHPLPYPAAKGPQPPHLYLHHQRTVEVIELIEVPPPPPRSHPYTSTLASSSFASSDSSEDDESVCSSYCSSEEDLDAARAPAYDDTYKIRLNRVLAWRDGFTKALDDADADAAAVPAPPPSTPVSSAPSRASSLKRKADSSNVFDSDDDTSSQSSKRSRSLPPHERAPAPPSWQQRRLSAHACPACDAGFATVQSLRQHGEAASLGDACREAVEYGFES